MKIILSSVISIVLSISVYSQDTCNCCTENHSQFDFWVGSWTVTNTKGDLVGSNIIDKIQENCILRENWTSAKGNFTGTSLNFYNNTSKQWEQIWIDNQGENLHLKGHRKGNQMILKSNELKDKDGEPYFNRITWTLNDDGSVRQYWETITNNNDITIAFDGLYKKAE